MTTYNYQQLNLGKTKTKSKLSEQLEQAQNYRSGYHMEGYQWGRGGRRMGKKVQRIRSITGRYKIDRGRLRIVQEMKKRKNLCMHHPWT